MGGLLIGISAGVVCYFATQFIKRVLRIDDSLDVFPVHGVGGALGTLLTAVFFASSLGGPAEAGYAMGLQFDDPGRTGVIATVLWCGMVTYILLSVLDSVMGLRVSADEETEGLDLVSHDERGYSL